MKESHGHSFHYHSLHNFSTPIFFLFHIVLMVFFLCYSLNFFLIPLIFMFFNLCFPFPKHLIFKLIHFPVVTTLLSYTAFFSCF